MLAFPKPTTMKLVRCCIIASAFIFAATCVVDARVVRRWLDAELFEKADLVVVATPTLTKETQRNLDHPDRPGQPVIGVETEFAVTAVLKGAQTEMVLLYHFRADRMELPNAPTFVSFDPAKKQSFRLFLIRRADGRYAPVAGQTDPELSIQEISK